MDHIYDIAIIGGGINGAGIARDAAGRGLSVYLCEKGDLAQGTSSASTKLIHGGLRYLEFYEFRLVREALKEREVLLKSAPHIIWPLEFVMPHNRSLRSAWLVRLGLFLYDHLGGRKMLPSSYKVDLRASRFGKPLKKYLRIGFVYSDCWVEDSRLVVLTARDAANRGAAIHNYTEFKSATPAGDHWELTVQPLSQDSETIKAKTIVNAAGPGLEKVAKRIAGKAGQVQPLRLVKGSHIVVSKLYDGEQAYILQNSDRRMVFVIPFENDYSLIGTTDLHQDPNDPTQPHITDSEVDYLLQAVNGYFAKAVTRTDIKYTYSGIRPLFDDGSANDSRVTRDYTLAMSGGSGKPSVLNVYGGKITTFRRLAEEAVDKILRHSTQARDMFKAEPWTHDAILPGGDLPVSLAKRDAQATPMAKMKIFIASLHARYAFLPLDQCERLAFTYGTGAELILEGATSLADLGQNFGGGLTAREVDYLVKHEWAREADDVLLRRTRLGMVAGLVNREMLVEYLSKD